MFSKIIFAIVSFFALFQIVVALPGHPSGGSSGDSTTEVVDQCNTENISCCNSVQSADDPVTQFLAGLLGVSLAGVTGQVGLSCSPVGVIALNGNSCSSQPVCCSNNDFNGLINIGCTPINVNA